MQDSWTDWPHQPDEQSRNRSRILTILTVVSVFPLFLLAGRILASGLPEVAMLSDHALLELSILRATTFDQLLGPYSRFGFHYPGPALAYLFAPGYLLSGCRYLSAAVSIAVINGVCIALLLWMVKRNEGTTAMAWTAALLSLLAVHVEPSVLSSPWNPHATILPFLLTLGAAASLANGRVWALPIAVASGSLCVQSHLVYALPLVVVATISLAGWITAKRREGLSKNRVIAIVSAALIAIAMWTPLVVAELSTDDSNLAKIANFILQDAPENSVGAA
ncbi:MAG: hypothetical protein GY906_26865, partial [bacterium]|nr:hypothetical protein [bacterium]